MVSWYTRGFLALNAKWLSNYYTTLSIASNSRRSFQLTSNLSVRCGGNIWWNIVDCDACGSGAPAFEPEVSSLSGIPRRYTGVVDEFELSFRCHHVRNIRGEREPYNRGSIRLTWYEGERVTNIIQLFRQRLCHKSVKAYATMSIGIMGSTSSALLDWGSRRFSKKGWESMNTHVFAVSFYHAETPWTSIKQPWTTIIIPFDIVAYVFTLW